MHILLARNGKKVTTCANITSLTGHVLPWTNKIRYLGIFLIESSFLNVL